MSSYRMPAATMAGGSVEDMAKLGRDCERRIVQADQQARPSGQALTPQSVALNGKAAARKCGSRRDIDQTSLLLVISGRL